MSTGIIQQALERQMEEAGQYRQNNLSNAAEFIYVSGVEVPNTGSGNSVKITLNLPLAPIQGVHANTVLESEAAKLRALHEARQFFGVADVGWSSRSNVFYKKDGKIMMGPAGGTADEAFIVYEIKCGL
jgi:hypothetical protein